MDRKTLATILVGLVCAVVAAVLPDAREYAGGVALCILGWLLRRLAEIGKGAPKRKNIRPRQKREPRALPKIVGLALLVAGTLALASPAWAEPQFGGCFASGNLCAGPSAAITVGEYNFSTAKFAGGVIPGVGYGLTYKPESWYATGLSFYLQFVVGQGQPNQAVPALMLSFANYLRLGLALQITEQLTGPTKREPVLMFAIGSDFGGSPSYVRQQMAAQRDGE